jgi:hypothetical protein
VMDLAARDLRRGSRPSRLPPSLRRVPGVNRESHLLRRAAGATTAALLAAFLACGQAPAATYHAQDGASLSAAVASANASGGTSTIELGAGTYLPTSTLNIDADVTIAGPSTAPPAKLVGSAVTPFPSPLLVVGAHAKLTLVNLELTRGGGGANPAIDDHGSVDLEDSTAAGNAGPGLLVEPQATATVRNSTFAEGLAGGVVADGTVTLVNVTDAFNKGVGVENKASLSLTNTIVARNEGGDCAGNATASDHSLDSDGSCGVGTLSRTDPRLAGLAANGGPTSTFALDPGSPAIGAADAARCQPEDQRHFVRPPGTCDIGAFQSGASGTGASTSPSGASGSSTSGGGAHRAIVGVIAHGALQTGRRSRISFSMKAIVGHRQARFLYTDHAARVVFRALTVKSLAFDGKHGTATLRGSGIDMAIRRRVNLTVTLVSHARQRGLRIWLSSGYRRSGRLLDGSITFMRA